MPVIRFSLPTRIILILSVMFASLSDTGTSRAETKYVSDILVINIRSSIESPYEVVASVYSDEPLTILGSQGKYYHVETEDGKQGWIAQQYVKDVPPKSQIIEQLRSENNGLSEKLQNTEDKLNDALEKLAAIPASGETSKLIDEKNALLQKNEELQQEISILKDTPDFKAKEELVKTKVSYQELLAEKDSLFSSYNGLKQQYSESEQQFNSQLDAKNLQIEELSAQISILQKRYNVYWFLAGAFVFLSGIIAGKVMSRKKKRYSYSL